MPYRANKIDCIEFTMAAFVGTVMKASGASEQSKPNAQTEYLAKYLRKDLQAQAILIENSYVDRHFIEEFSAYYARCLEPIRNTCVRLHFFSAAFTNTSLDTLIERAAQGEAIAVEKELDDAYLGFIVIRPLASAPIGRTVLDVPQDLETRKYESITKYSVHLLGFNLTVSGIAFQQQDVAVGACATTALWTALQRMARHDGGRAPTPWAITKAATKHLLSTSGPAPGRGGLLTQQYCEALRTFDFGAEVIQLAKKAERFEQILGIYLRSGIPIILSVETKNSGHAVAVVGYRRTEHPSYKTAFQFTILDENGGSEEQEHSLLHENTAYDRLFIHDDRFGPYASAKLVPPKAPLAMEKALYLELKQHANDCNDVCSSSCHTAEFLVRHATVPLYPKLRSSAEDLLQNAYELKPPLMKSLMLMGAKVSLELYFERSGDYLASLYGMGLDPARLISFLRNAALSRYVGIARWRIDGEPIMDSVWDTTDIRRSYRSQPTGGLLALVALHPAYDTLVDARAVALHVLAG